MPSLPSALSGQVCQFGLPVRIFEPHGADGNVSLLELVILNHLVAQRQPTTLFEFGTFDGRTTRNLAANAPDDAIVFTIDLPRLELDNIRLELDINEIKYIEKAQSGARFLGTQEASKIIQLFGDTATFDFSKWYGVVDFVFVDASHAEDFVRNDTEVAMRLIGERNGIIVWHDYSVWPGVTNVLEQYQKNDVRFKNLVRIHQTSLAFCEPNSPSSVVAAVSAEDIAAAYSYWRRYPDVAAGEEYGKNGKMGLRGARQHYEDFGRSEGRIWDDEETLMAYAYWLRYPDVAAGEQYGEKGRLGVKGPRQHFEDHGRAEGRVWGL